MLKPIFYSIAFIALFSLSSIHAQKADRELTTGDLAKFFNISWASFDLPGETHEKFAIGLIIEFGDNRKPIKSGTMAPITAGSKIKLMVRPVEDKLEYGVIATRSDGVSDSSHGKLNYPKDYLKHKMYLGGPVEDLTNWYILKASSKAKSLSSHSPLEENELGVRLYFEPYKE